MFRTASSHSTNCCPISYRCCVSATILSKTTTTPSIIFFEPQRSPRICRTKEIVYGSRQQSSEEKHCRLASILRQADLRQTKVERRCTAPEFTLAGHRLNVAIPLQCERRNAELYRPAYFFLRVGVHGKAADNFDLPLAMADVLISVQAVSRRRAWRKGVMTGQLAVHFA